VVIEGQYVFVLSSLRFANLNKCFHAKMGMDSTHTI
jgi:hypothetical protein